MKQFEAEIISIETNEVLFLTKIVSMHWKDGFLWLFVVDFMDNGVGFVGFFLDKNGEYLDANNNLKAIVNYPPTAKLMGWASEVIDSPNGNALLRFCLSCDSIPEPQLNIFKPCFLMFMLAFKSLSCMVLQLLQAHFLSFRVKS